MLDNEVVQDQRDVQDRCSTQAAINIKTNTNPIDSSVQSLNRPTPQGSAKNSIQHRINIMFNELKGREQAFPYDRKSEFEDAILSSKNTELEVKYWESLAKRR